MFSIILDNLILSLFRPQKINSYPTKIISCPTPDNIQLSVPFLNNVSLCCTEQYVYCDSFYVCRKKSSTNYGVFAILRNVSLDASNRRVHYYSKMYKKNLTHKYYKCNIKRKHCFFTTKSYKSKICGRSEEILNQKWLVKVMYIMLCVSFLTACEKRNEIEEKKDRDITSEIAVTPFTNKKDNIDWNSSVVKKDGKLYFDISLEGFIDAYNSYYQEDHGRDYIKPLLTWYSYRQDFGRLKGDMCYEYTADKKILTLPTITVYTPKNAKCIETITLNFDDHSYTEKMYKQYEELCYYTLKVFFPDMAKQDLIDMYEKSNEQAYKHIFQTEKGFYSNNPPSDLYYRGGVGIYPYFAYGESVRMCIIPVNQKLIELYVDKGVKVHRLEKSEVKGK